MIKWGSFVKGKKNEWDGLNNAAIYSFNSNVINSFVREMFQNSIDARDKSLALDPDTGKIPPLRIRINYKEIKQEEFPDFEGFYTIFKKIASSSPNKQHSKFFNNAFKSLGNGKKIPLFIYEDFNTTGLSGSDDDPEKGFNACVISEGISVKPETTAGGSFGIGKNAIYGLSKFRTVFYSSVDKDGVYVFQGKAKLASYDDNDETHDNKIYCGEGDDYHSVRNLDDLGTPYNKIFFRDQPGLSQYAVFPVENEMWPEEFAKAILRNYWMLLEKGELIVELFEQDEIKYELSGEKLEGLMYFFYNPDEYEPDDISPRGNPGEFYKCFKEGKCLSPDNLGPLGKVRFYFNEIDDRNTNAVAYMRNDMVVYTDSVWGFGSYGYCGVFMCDDDRGNEILRAMEPPTHDLFSANRLEEKLEGYSVKDGKEILSQIKKLVRNGLQEIIDKYTKPVEDIPWLDDLLSSLTGAAGIGAGDRTNVKSEKETTEKIGEEVRKALMFKSQNRNTVVNDVDGVIEGTGGGRQDQFLNPGPSIPGPGPDPGPHIGDKSVSKSKIKSRIFRTNKKRKMNDKEYAVYQVHLTSEKSIENTDILVSQQGDSGNVVIFELGNVEIVGGRQLQFSEEKNGNSEIFAYRIKSIDVPSVLELCIDEPYKSSFRIIKL